ncbi:MAG: ABC transporter transmembrane region 2-domain-containing protein [Lentinula lateritia]|uniref:ABC transporter transmembrane region 2-domain-containing protein n=1 Tax=Lentinula lateritia TaxID=40482 RepID=A0ABQ8VIG5_9AGAR|nr:MAG: ABC transporter transmembrane region 2-domain-containing protein [Lentinula lateritia]KAJ4495438.1 ABC transporter transmembrane region 2-domain-containing protein [Lentinula lateritia]
MAVLSTLRPSNRLLQIIFILLILRTRLITLPKDSFERLRNATAGKRLSAAELTAVLQQIYIKERDGSKTLLAPYRNRLAKVSIHEIAADILASNAKHFPLQSSDSKKSKGLLDPKFVRALRALLFHIAIPSLKSKEAFILAVHSFFLVARTVLSVAVARLDGIIVRDLVRADARGFLRGLGLWFALAVPSTYTNVMIKHLQSTLALRIRTRLTRYIHDLYLSNYPDLRYYRLGLGVGVKRDLSGEEQDTGNAGSIEGVDQYITADIEAWAEGVSGLYGNLMKPTLDLVLFTSQLSRSLGLRGTILLFGTYYATVRILKAVTPAFGKLSAVEAKLEGDYRAGMGRLGREGEEIAFYDGGARERDILTRAYMNLIRHVNFVYKIRIAYEWTEDYVIKYLWSAAGYGLIAVPLLFTRRRRPAAQFGSNPGSSLSASSDGNEVIASRTETYISNRRLLLSLADAGGRLMYAYKDVLELAGVTERLYSLVSSLYAVKPVSTGSNFPSSSGDVTNDIIGLEHVDIGTPAQGTSLNESHILSDSAEFVHVKSQSVLIRDLSLWLREGSGEHLMITGSNGVGKTAIARVLAGLWGPSNENGKVFRPQSLMVVPQRVYMPVGTLLDQVIYPDSYADFLEKDMSIEPREGGLGNNIRDILESVFLSYLPEREGGWSTRKEWRDVLSGGEKQRMAMARVFYHRPKFAILDECTSAVSSDVEGRMYQHARSLGITLITISLRPSLMKYHTQVLNVLGDDTGRWTLAHIGQDAVLTPMAEAEGDEGELWLGFNKEIASLERTLKKVDGWDKRLKELNTLLKM